MRHLVGEVSFWLIAATLKLWGHGWISTETSRAWTTAIMRRAIWLLKASAEQPAEEGE